MRISRILNVSLCFVATTLLLAMVSGCGKQTSAEGKVVDSFNSPLTGVTVVAKQLQPVKGYEEVRAVTSDGGQFRLSGLFPESGYEIHVEGNNWVSHPKDYDTITAGPKGETSLLADPVMVSMAVNKSGSLIFVLETGICRFEKSQDGFITDATTALQWCVLPGKMNWFEAQNKIRQLGDGWRFPRMDELKALYVKDLGTCNIDPLFDLRYGDIYGGDFYGGCVWSNYVRRLAFNLTISHSFRFPYGSPSPTGGEPDAKNDRMRAFAVRSLEGP